MPKGNKSAGVKDKLIHPKSRKAVMLARKNIRAHRIDKNKGERDLNQNLNAQRVLWFKENVTNEVPRLSPDEVVDVIDRYLHRFDEELQQIDIVNSIKGRKKEQHLSRKNTIKFTIERETRQFNESGLDVPDLMSRKSISSLRAWNGAPRNVVNIKQMKVTRAKLEKLAAKSDNVDDAELDDTLDET